MKWPAIILAGFALTASAEKDTDYPHRDWGRVVTLNMPLAAATACVTRQVSKLYGRVTPVPAEGGTDVEGGPGGGLFGVAHDPWVSYQVRGAANGSVLRVFYRHPVSQKTISREVKRMGEKCLQIASIAPA